MARQQVLSSLHQNQTIHMQNQPKYNMNNTHPKLNRLRTESLSSLSSSTSHASSSRGRQRNDTIMSPSVLPDENKRKRERVPFVEMFSPVRAIRAARAGMKRKRGGGPVIVASSRGTILGKGRINKPVKDSKMMGFSKEGRKPAESVDTEQTKSRSSSRRMDSRDASNSSLHRGMRALILTDQDSATTSMRPVVSSRKVSASGSVRSTRSRMQRQQVREESEDEGGDDAEEDERLLSQAPSWQLHRLKKSRLLKLHILLGTWREDEEVDLDLYNKQELVEGLIKARSNKIVSRSSAYSDQLGSREAIASSSTSSSASMKRRLTNSTLMSHSSAYTDEEASASESESEDNDAGGEETEAEPTKASARRQQHQLEGVSSPMTGRLRYARSRVGGRGIEGNKSSLASSRLSSPLGRRLKPSRSMLFAASSPVRTRKGAARMQVNGGIKGRLTVPLNRTETARDVFPRKLNETPKQARRRKGSDKNKNVAFGQGASLQKQKGPSDDQPEWEDASPQSLQQYALNPPRRAKVKAQEQLQHLNAGGRVEQRLDDEDDDYEGEECEGNDYEEGGDMSLDETPTRLRLQNQVKQLDIDEISDEEYDCEIESHSYDTDVNASPSKMRKLRNGKIRLPTINVARTLQSEEMTTDEAKPPHHPEGEEEEDVDMEDGEIGNDTLDAAMEAPSIPSLLRLKRNQLVELCGRLYIDIAPDATKAVIADAILADTKLHPPLSSSGIHRSKSSDSGLTIGPNSSISSTNSSTTKTHQGQSKQSEKEKLPLLLRSHSNQVQAIRPSSPIPSQALQSPTTACEDELNGLDLELLNLTDKEIPFRKLEKLEKIGSGGFKDVYIGKYQISKKTTKKVAIADIRDQLSEMDIKELTLLRDLKHENIVRFIGVCVPPLDMRMVPCMIVSELCSNGDLFDYIRNVSPPPDEEIFRLLLETAKGLEYLHTRKPAIIHRDCKSTNVLVTRNKTAKINDFGLARVRNSKKSMIKSLVGTVNWQAVELWSPKPNYNEKVDVWSAGMTFWEVLQWHEKEKKYPFEEMNEHQIYQDVGQKRIRPSTISIRRQYGDEIVELLDKMWNHYAKDRPTMTQVCLRLEELIEMKKGATSRIKQHQQQQQQQTINKTLR